MTTSPKSNEQTLGLFRLHAAFSLVALTTNCLQKATRGELKSNSLPCWIFLYIDLFIFFAPVETSWTKSRGFFVDVRYWIYAPGPVPTLATNSPTASPRRRQARVLAVPHSNIQRKRSWPSEEASCSVVLKHAEPSQQPHTTFVSKAIWFQCAVHVKAAAYTYNVNEKRSNISQG